MISQKTLQRIVERQGRFEWGNKYLAGIFAIPGEAPKGSRVSRLNSRKLGRTLHLLSTPERVFTQLALFNPRVFDIHEQKMLYPGQHLNPLNGHPLATGANLHPVLGTLAIATRIGFDHAKVVVEDANGQRRWLPHPYLGDLLLYLKGEDGNPLAVNWTIKLSESDFGERGRGRVKTLLQQRRDQEHIQLRNLLEEEYYLSAGIRTSKLSMDVIDPIVVANLDLLYGSHDLLIDLDKRLLEDYSNEIQEVSNFGLPVAPVAIKYGQKWGRRDLFLAKIYQDIWNRNLKVDLFEPILIDHPLNVGGRDVLETYDSLFRGLPA